MLSLPTKGLSRSTGAHNVDLDVLADWLEASVTFQCADRVSTTEVVDLLLADYVYEDRDFCGMVVSDVREVLEDRLVSMGEGATFELSSRTISSRGDWERWPAASFLLFLSLGRVYQRWARDLGPDYNLQGELFERICDDAVSALFPSWRTYRTGWTRGAPRAIGDVVAQLSDELGLANSRLEPWVDRNANEAGVDLVLHRRFRDGRAATPTFLVQCASGQNWSGKTQEPELRVWTKIVSFVSEPTKGFALPFALSERDFLKTGNLVNGLLLDRCRIVSAGAERGEEWVSEELRVETCEWLRDRLGLLEAQAM